MPGWKTSEAWISFLVIVLGALPSSGLIDDSSSIAKIVGLIVAALSAINYTYQRSALKRAYYAATLTRPPAASSPVAAIASLLVVLVALGTLPSCNTNCQDPKNASSAQCIVSGAVVDCTGVSSLPSAVTVVKPIITKLIASAQQPDGSINWSSIEQQIVDLALQYGACVVAEVWSDLMGSGTLVAVGSAGSGSAAAGSAAALPSPDDLKKEFDRIRARVAPGRTFAVGGGRKL